MKNVHDQNPPQVEFFWSTPRWKTLSWNLMTKKGFWLSKYVKITISSCSWYTTRTTSESRFLSKKKSCRVKENCRTKLVVLEKNELQNWGVYFFRTFGIFGMSGIRRTCQKFNARKKLKKKFTWKFAFSRAKKLSTKTSMRTKSYVVFGQNWVWKTKKFKPSQAFLTCGDTRTRCFCRKTSNFF